MSEEIKEERKAAPTLTHKQAVQRMEDIHVRMEEIGEQDEIDAETRSEFDELAAEFRQLEQHVERMEIAAELAAVRTAAPEKGKRKYRVEAGSSQGSRSDYDRDAILEPDSIEDCRFRNPWDLSEVRTYGRGAGEVSGELRARALSAIEKCPGASDDVRQAATEIIERFDTVDSRLARQALVTSSPAYMRAWSKLAKNQQHQLSADESRALNEAEQFRAMSLTDSAGGYLVPFQLDPTVIITANGSRNDIRQVARQVVATSDTWNGVSSGSVSWSWDTEASQVSDDSTTFAQPSIPVYKAAGFVPISIEALADEQNVTSEVAKLLAFGKDELEATAFVTGSGSNQPTGFVTALTGGSSIVSCATDDTFALADVYSLQGALPARYRANASWIANNLIYNKIRQFDTAGGNGLWAQLGDGRPSVLLGRNAIEAEAMDGTLTTSGAVHNYILGFGDWENYVIVDRIGMTVEFIPHLFNTANNRPTGQRGWYAYYRVGADSVNDGGLRLLDMVSAS